MTEPLEYPGPVREPVRVLPVDGHGSVARMLSRLETGAFQGRKLGEAFAALRRMIDGPTLICAGLAGSMSSAGLWPLLTWLLDRGYVDLLVSTAANVTEDLLEQRGVAFYRVDPDRVDDRALWEKGFYRFYDHVVSSVEYDRMEDFTATFFEHLAATWTRPVIPGVRFMHEWGRWLDAQGLGGSIAATCARRESTAGIAAPPGRAGSALTDALLRATCRTRSTGWGRSGFRLRGGGSGSLACLCRIASGVSASKGTRPTSISYSTTPIAYTSLRASYWPRCPCSGAM